MKILSRRRVLFTTVFAVPLGLLTMSLMSRRPPKLGIAAGTLCACPESPNCVNSFQKKDLHFIEPFSAEPDQVLSLLNEITQIVRSMPRTQLIDESETYRRFECRTQVFQFVDDLELLAVPELGVVHVRSSSRVGHSDLGANRMRVESIRRLLRAKLNGIQGASRDLPSEAG